MKQLFFTLVFFIFNNFLFAQDTIPAKVDTIRVGGMIIIKTTAIGGDKHTNVNIGHNQQRNSKFSTASFIFDLGFANWTDKTNYTTAASQNYLVTNQGATFRPAAIASNDFNLKDFKSSNVNIWLFMQRLSLVKRYLNIKYGFGVELNNYRFNSNISFKEAGVNPFPPTQNINHYFVMRDTIAFSKNKLAADYATIPFLLNVRTNPNSNSKGLSLSAGVSVGYLYSSRNKQVSSERGKRKNRGDYDLEKFKFSYIGELGLGPVRFYGSYVPKSIFKNGLNLMPYTVGIRFSNW